VVRAVDWSVPRGTVCGLVGPNGAGKTTLLRMVVGLVGRTSGSVRVGGATVVNGAPPPRTGALIESPGFVPHLSGRANVRLLAKLRGQGDAAADAAIARVSLQGRANDRYRTYSLGMKQRLGVAGALIGAPGLLVLDEPSNGLDPAGVADMQALIHDLARQGVTVIVSSHALGDVERLCHQVAVMVEGSLVAVGAVADLVGPVRTRIRTSDHLAAARAASVALPHGHLTRHVVRRDDCGWFLDAEVSPDLVPRMVRALVEAGVDVHEVASVRRTLAEVYETLLRDRR